MLVSCWPPGRGSLSGERLTVEAILTTNK
jgi:hypothetical protein